MCVCVCVCVCVSNHSLRPRFSPFFVPTLGVLFPPLVIRLMTLVIPLSSRFVYQ